MESFTSALNAYTEEIKMLILVIRIHMPSTKQRNIKMHAGFFLFLFFFSSNSRDAYLT